MKIILKSCTIVDEGNSYSAPQDILIENGIISEIAPSINKDADQTIEVENLHVSTGWFDARVHFCDPGEEVKEDIHSGLKAAAIGGFTAVGLRSATTPPLSNKSQIEYVKMKAAQHIVDLYPYATLTEQRKGDNLAEMFDLQQAGAIGFTDDNATVSGGIMYRALLYTKNFESRVITFPLDQSIFGEGYVHEGKETVKTGLKAIPSLAESMTIERDLNLVRYTGGKLHFTGISTKESVELIRKAKAEGLAVTADVYLHNLVYNEKEVLGFDSAFKVMPPLRSEDDRLALIQGIKDGTIDCICSDHTPEDIENKEVEFDHAAFGMIGLQTFFCLINQIQELTLIEKIKAISAQPRAIFGLPQAEIKTGNKANLTLFTTSNSTVVSSDWIVSKSKNTPLIGQELSGKVYGVFNDDQLALS